MPDPRILAEAASPLGNQQALVEDDAASVYLYLQPGPNLPRPLRSCWVRNLGPAPRELDREAMAAGRAPQLPARHTRFPMGGQPSLRPEELELVWLEDADSVALLDRGELIAAVLGDEAGDAGYARDCKEASPVCLPLTEAKRAEVLARVESARAFFAAWADPDKDAWTPLRERLLAAQEAALGPHARYFAVGGEAWPPRFLARHEREGAASEAAPWVVGVSGGVSILQQPRAPGPAQRRIELGFAVDAGFPAEAVQRLFAYVAAQTAYPWAACAWLGEGHTFPCRPFPLPTKGAEFSSVLLTAAPPGAPALRLPDYRGEPVTLLWLLPITEAERALAQKEGGAALLGRLAEAGVGWCFRDRKSVA